jgi:adenine-specific DNA-methyltransferase
MREGQKTAFAKQLRAVSPDAERVLWQNLRNRRFQGAKFRRQHPIGPYVTDFACLENMLVIELDGGQHAQAIQYDERRTAFLESQSYRVLRFWDHDVLMRTESVLDVILQALPAPHPSPLPHAGEGTSVLSVELQQKE